MSASLHYKAVTLTLGHTVIVRDFSLSVEAGDIVWLQGANGIGKTSLLRLAAGFIRPNVGYMAWQQHGVSVTARQTIGFQSHKDSFKAKLSVREELMFWAQAYEQNDNGSSITTLAERFALNDLLSQQCGTLSAGQRRRLALARLWLSGRPIWVMDEPLAALDKAGEAMVESMIKDHVAQGGAALIASHNTARSLGPSTRRLVMSAGLTEGLATV